MDPVRSESTEAVAERRESRTAFSDLGARRAIALGQDEYKDELAHPVFEALNPGPDTRLVEIMDAHTGIVLRDGKRLLVTSPGPLAAAVRTDDSADTEDDLAPLDLGLMETPRGFEPTRSAVPFEIGKRLDDGVELDDRFTVHLRSSANPDTIVSKDRAWYPDVRTDTDYIVTPLPTGAELSLLLRSTASPERYGLDIDLPDGAQLRWAQPKQQAVQDEAAPQGQPQTVEVVMGDKTLGYIYRPIAYDADGVVVDSEATIEGDSIRLSVDHHGRDLRYPLYVDPPISVDGTYVANDRGAWTGWNFFYSGQGSASDFGVAWNDPAWAQGVYMQIQPNKVVHTNDNGALRYSAPAYSYIDAVNYGSFSHRAWRSGIVEGVSTAQNTWESGIGWINETGVTGTNPDGMHVAAFSNVSRRFCHVAGGTAPSQYRCVAGANLGPDHNYATIALSAQAHGGDNPFSTANNNPSLSMGYATVDIGDRHRPIFAAAPASSGWIDDTGNTARTVSYKGSDSGLGIAQYDLIDPKKQVAKTFKLKGVSCTGDPYRSPCPDDYPSNTEPMRTFDYVRSEGSSTMAIRAIDVVGNVGTTSWVDRVDRTAPAVSISGPLTANEALLTRTASFTVSATDGSTTSDSARRSGVTQIDVFVDDNLEFRATQTCGTDSCPMKRAWTYDSDQYGAGEHEIRAVAYDKLGHSSSTSFTSFTPNDARPEVTAKGELTTRGAEYVGSGTIGIEVRGMDNSDTGIQKLEVFGNGTVIGSAAFGCSPSCVADARQSFTVDTTGIPEGPTRFDVAATDNANTIRREEAVMTYVDRTPPPAATDVIVDDFVGGTTTVDWEAADDPPLAGGGAGSGTASSRYRYQLDGVSWSGWKSSEYSTVEIDGTSSGRSFLLEVQTRDEVGNASAVVRTELTPRDDEAQTSQTANSNHSSSSSDDPIVPPGTQPTCQPRLRDARVDLLDANHDKFTPRMGFMTTRLNVFCFASASEFATDYSLTGGIAVRTGSGYNAEDYTKLFDSDKLLPLGTFVPRDSRDRPINGPAILCKPLQGGTQEYVIFGKITFTGRRDGKAYTFDYNTSRSKPMKATCPNEGQRRAYEVAGWRYLRETFAQRNSSDKFPAADSPSMALRSSLGGQPYTPQSTKRAWAAHHTVPASKSGTQDLWALLYRCRIHPNSSSNGVYLRNGGGETGLRKKRKSTNSANSYYQKLKDEAPSDAKRAYHGDTYGGDYVQEMRRRLQSQLTAAPEQCGDSPRDRVLGILAAAGLNLVTSDGARFGRVPMPN